MAVASNIEVRIDGAEIPLSDWTESTDAPVAISNELHWSQAMPGTQAVFRLRVRLKP